jgi:hypothetical protein
MPIIVINFFNLKKVDKKMDVIMILVLGGIVGAGIYVYQDIKKTFSFSK